ncbi:MAG: M1 family metallopeptidase [Bacteroidetes bacterium]|nr:M1 family metallopeptidase [Bacteroidota bacterium]
MRILLSLVTLVSLATLASAQPFFHTETRMVDPAGEPREHPVDMLRMTIDVRFSPESGLVKGRVTHVFRVLRQRVDSIVFDAIDISIKQATLDAKPVRFRSTDTSVIVYPEPWLRWDRTDSVSFTYEASPRRGLYFTGWDDPTHRARTQIWTQGQAIDNRHWVPLYDEMNDKMITETIVTFDRAYEVLSNGTKISVVDNSDGTRTWHYRMTHPHASYLVMIGIGKYGIEERTAKSGVPLHLYYYPEWHDRVGPTYTQSAEAMNFLEEEIGIPYPWESYSQIPVQDFIFGAMENTTATVFGDFYHVDARAFIDRNYVDVNVHELTHQWFGDLITARSNKGTWLQESYATFYPHLFKRRTQGEAAYEWGRRGMHKAALAASEKDRLPIVHPKAGTSRVYPKGAAVIDMMRHTFGEEQVRRVIQHYLKHHAYGNVETNDLLLSFQDTLGLTPTWFFDEWLYKGGEPHYKVSYQAVEKGGMASTLVLIDQIHDVDGVVGYFTMPIPVEVHYTDGGKDSVRAMVEGQRTIVDVPNPGKRKIGFVLFDPASVVIKKVTFDKSFDERLLQARKAPHMIDRFDALESLRGDATHRTERMALLRDVMSNESFSAMRVEAVQQAVDLGISEESVAIVTRGLSDRSADVRSAALAAFPTIPAAMRSAVEPLLRDSSYVVEQNALTKLCASFPDGKAGYLDATKNDHGMHERMRIAWLEVKIADGDSAALQELVDYGSRAFEFRTRQNAFEALRRCNLLPLQAVTNLLDAVVSFNDRLSGPATSVLEHFRAQTQYAALIRTVASARTETGWKRDRLANFTK